MSYEDFKLQMKNQVLTQRVVGEEVGRRIAVPEAEMQKYYEEHKTEFLREEQVFLSQIVISTEGKTARTGGGRRKESQGPGGARQEGRKVQRPGARQFRRRRNREERRLYRRHEAGADGQADRSRGLQGKEGLRHRSHPPAEFLPDPQSGRALRSRAGVLRGSEERAARAPHPAQNGGQGAHFPHRAARGCVPRNQGRLHR